MNAVKVCPAGYANGMKSFGKLKFHVNSMR
ncbi:hypothetical protein BCEP4_1350044 [Burkholderia cepacia]|nr:hypothetical protein BCEP4_1350044 [Burkholderia cepacia]